MHAWDKVCYFVSWDGKEAQLLYLSGCWAQSGFVFVCLLEKN